MGRIARSSGPGFSGESEVWEYPADASGIRTALIPLPSDHLQTGPQSCGGRPRNFEARFEGGETKAELMRHEPPLATPQHPPPEPWLFYMPEALPPDPGSRSMLFNKPLLKWERNARRKFWLVVYVACKFKQVTHCKRALISGPSFRKTRAKTPINRCFRGKPGGRLVGTRNLAGARFKPPNNLVLPGARHGEHVPLGFGVWALPQEKALGPCSMDLAIRPTHHGG